MANQFYVLLPSNTPGYTDNSPNKFRVHLPKTINFDGNFVCGLHSIIYTHSWPSVGTTEEQWIELNLKNGKRIRTKIPRYSYSSAQQLENTIHTNMSIGLEESLRNRERQQIIIDDRDKELIRTIRSEAATQKSLKDKFIDRIKGGKDHQENETNNAEGKPIDSLKTITFEVHTETGASNASKENELISTAEVEKSLKDKFINRIKGTNSTTENELQLAEQQQKELYTAKRVAVKLFEQIEDGNKQIQKFYYDAKAVYDQVILQNILPENKANSYKNQILKFYDELYNINTSSHNDYMDANAAKNATLEAFEEKNIRNAKTNADTLKLVHIRMFGQKLDAENSKIGYGEKAEQLKKQLIDEYNIKLLPLLRKERGEEETVENRYQEYETPPITPEVVLTEKSQKDKFIETIKGPSSDKPDVASPPIPEIHTTEPSIKDKFIETIKSTTKEEPTKVAPSTDQSITTSIIDGDIETSTQRKRKLKEKFIERITGRRRGLEYIAEESVYLPYDYTDEKIKELVESIRFRFDPSINKFTAQFNNAEIEQLQLSPQIAYILGFENGIIDKSDTVAKYSFNLQGGLNSFCVYTNGLTENIIMGNELVSLLRVVAVSGNHGDTIEKIYDAPMYSRVLPRQINEIEIELRTLEGQLIPFQFGVTIVTLVFKKVIVF